MAIERGVAGGRQSKGLAAWETVPKTQGPIPGTHSYKPLEAEEKKYGTLTSLTPYTMPAPTQAASRATARPETARSLADIQQRQESNPWANGFASPTWDNPDAWATEAVHEDVEGNRRPSLDDGLPEQDPIERRSYEMSWDDYQKLTDSQQAAVDFNTLLIQAREKDLTSEYEATEDQRKRYRADMHEMFGKERGSETYAPETLAVLKQIDFKATDQDLDDFLSLDITVDAEDLKGFKAEPVQQSVMFADGDVQASNAYVGTAQLAVNTRELAAKMAEANKVMQNYLAAAARDRNATVEEYGGTPNNVRPRFGFGTSSERKNPEREGFDEFLQSAFETVAVRGREDDAEYLKGAWERIEAGFKMPGDREKLLRYFDLRSRQAMEHGTSLGMGQGYRSPEEFRKIFNFDRGGD